MIKKIRIYLSKYYYSIINSIAFYPSVIFLSLTALAFVLLYIEDRTVSEWLINNAEYLVINNASTARSILSTMIAGLISLMVFSFSMVMSILSQASANFSPRLLPGLISDKRNQLVLGFYLGTIIFNIVVLMSVIPSGNEYQLSVMSILVAIVLGLICLVLFIYFINGISQDVQINNILKHIYDKTYCRLKEISDMDRNLREVPEYQFEDLIYLKSTKAGYYQGVNVDKLKDLAESLQTNIVVIPVKGQYVLPNENLLGLTNKVDEKELEALGNWFLFSYSNDVSNNYILGLQQIKEVGVKAMSPGINDPGTAMNTLDYLSELLSMRMKIGDVEVVANEDSKYVVQLSTINFDELLYNVLSGYRQYSKHDVNIVRKLILILKYLESQPYDCDSYLESIKKQLSIIKEDYEKSITNTWDKEMLDKMYDSSYFNLRTG